MKNIGTTIKPYLLHDQLEARSTTRKEKTLEQLQKKLQIVIIGKIPTRYCKSGFGLYSSHLVNSILYNTIKG